MISNISTSSLKSNKTHRILSTSVFASVICFILVINDKLTSLREVRPNKFRVSAVSSENIVVIKPPFNEVDCFAILFIFKIASTVLWLKNSCRLTNSKLSFIALRP